jgi:AraC-like DNA-binding protein
MPIELTLSNEPPLEFQPGFPAHYRGPVLRGASVISVKTNIADLVIQELDGEGYSIRFSLGKFLSRVTANGVIRNKGLYSYFMLKNAIRKEIKSLGKLHIRQNHYSFFVTEPTACSARFEKNNEFRSLDIFYSPKFLEELLPYFPELKDVMLASPARLLTPKASWTLPTMKEIAAQILDCPYDESTRQFYFDLKVRELLYQLLQNAFKRKGTDRIYTPWEVSKIHEAKTILETYISKKAPSIKTLSRQVALNEFKLKDGFRKYFGSGIFEWLMEQRMQEARRLILSTNKPIKDICAMVGYPRTTNFITAFKRRFGMTPGSLRR